MMDFVDKLLDLEEVTKARKVQLQKLWERGAFTPVHRQEIPKGSQIFSHKWLTSVPKEHPSHASHALTSRLATQHHFVSHEHTVTTGGFRAVFWEPSKDLREAVDDIVGFLNYLRHHQQAFAKGATTQLLVLCNRTAVHNMLLHHGFHHAWVAFVSLPRGPAGNRTTTGSLSATQECRDTNCTTRTISCHSHYHIIGGRCHIPYCSYCAGSSVGAADMPHWMTRRIVCAR